jgi:uncharacterized protein (TIGR02145 family)
MQDKQRAGDTDKENHQTVNKHKTMKKTVLFVLGLFISTCMLQAQNDTLYIMKSGTVLGKYPTSDIDSIIFYNPMTAGLILADIDGNTYRTVTVGTQTWMAENLRTTHYADGTPIPKAADQADWAALTDESEAYCWYNNDSARNANPFGALYTWAAAMKGAPSSTAVPSGIQGVCPTGWHLPSDAEFTTLVSYLLANGYNYDGTTTGNKIGKAIADTSRWQASVGEGTVGNSDYPAYRNKSGLSAVPGGYRDQWGTFFFLGGESHWWSATEYSSFSSEVRSLFYYSVDFNKLPPSCYYKKNGFSVRCMKD